MGLRALRPLGIIGGPPRIVIGETMAVQGNGGMVCSTGLLLIFGEAKELLMQFFVIVAHISHILFVLVTPRVIVVCIPL
jgi:hypothetical protein